jgi:hypothetical protein
MVDVAALRHALMHDEFLIRRYKQRLGSASKASWPLLNEALRAYDETIRRILSDGELGWDLNSRPKLPSRIRTINEDHSTLRAG